MDPSAFGVVPTRADGEVVAFVEKPPPGQAPTDWINAGTYVLEPDVINEIPPRLTVSIERETFPRMLETPGRVYAMRSASYWLDIGTPQKYIEAQLDVANGRLGDPAGPGRDRGRAVRLAGAGRGRRRLRRGRRTHRHRGRRARRGGGAGRGIGARTRHDRRRAE